MLAFTQFVLTEKVLSIGLNPNHEKYREHHRGEMHDMIRKSYSKIGGYGGHASGSDEESKTIHDDITNSHIKAIRRNGKISAVSLYKPKFGRKKITAATDGSDQGKQDYIKTTQDDNKMKRAWGEVSGAPEHISRKHGIPVVPNKHAAHLTGKQVELDPDGEHYVRKIGGHAHKKVIMGHPKI